MRIKHLFCCIQFLCFAVLISSCSNDGIDYPSRDLTETISGRWVSVNPAGVSFTFNTDGTFAGTLKEQAISGIYQVTDDSLFLLPDGGEKMSFSQTTDARYIRLSGIVDEEPTNITLQTRHIGDLEFADLGLPGGVLWATANVGAASLADEGDFFQWTGTEDYAKTFMGDLWSTPTCCQFDDLLNSKYTTISILNGVYIITSNTTGESIQIPCGGVIRGEESTYLKNKCCLWTKDCCSDINAYGYTLDILPNTTWKTQYLKSYGLNIRAVTSWKAIASK